MKEFKHDKVLIHKDNRVFKQAAPTASAGFVSDSVDAYPDFDASASQKVVFLPVFDTVCRTASG